MTLRDIRDLGKTVLLPLFEFLFASTVLFMESWKNEPEKKKEETILKLLALRMELLELFYLLLAASKENSLYDSLLEIGKNPAHEYNRNFEEVLKGNAENAYCQSKGKLPPLLFTIPVTMAVKAAPVANQIETS